MRSLWVALVFSLAGMAVGWYAHEYLSVAFSGLSPVQLQDKPRVSREPDDADLARAGDFTGLAARAGDNVERFISALSKLSMARRQAAIAVYVRQQGESFSTSFFKAGLLGEQDDFVGQVKQLLSAALLVRTDQAQHRLEAALSNAMDGAARQLLADRHYDVLDKLYEQVTLALPELPAYKLKLGLFRIQTGNFDAALSPLSQIENNPQLGARARALIVQAETSESFKAPTGQTLPLRARGSQFVIDATLDGGRKVPMLIDTGAAMTIVDESVLRALGYSLGGHNEYFVTANGVVAAPIVSLGRLALGEASIDQLAVGALPLDLPGGIHGLLGMNFLRHFDFTIDQAAKQLKLDQRQ